VVPGCVDGTARFVCLAHFGGTGKPPVALATRPCHVVISRTNVCFDGGSQGAVGECYVLRPKSVRTYLFGASSAPPFPVFAFSAFLVDLARPLCLLSSSPSSQSKSPDCCVLQQYQSECWCGYSAEVSDYTRHGEGVCHLPCLGDDSIACGEGCLRVRSLTFCPLQFCCCLLLSLMLAERGELTISLTYTVALPERWRVNATRRSRYR